VTKEDVMRMAQEAGDDWDHTLPEDKAFLERFAALVAAHERKECVKVCEEQMKAYMSSEYTTDPLGGYRERLGAGGCAVAIRLRGET